MVNLQLLLFCLYIFIGKPAIGKDIGDCFLKDTRTSGSVIVETTYTGKEECAKLCLTYTACKGVAISPTSWDITGCYIVGPHSIFTDKGWKYADRTCYEDFTDTDWECYDYTDDDWQWSEMNGGGHRAMCEHAGGHYKGPGLDYKNPGCGKCWCCQWIGEMKKKKLSAGGIVGIVAAVVAVIFGVIMYRKRKQRQRSQRIEIEHTRYNNTAPNIPAAPHIPAPPEQEDTVQGRTDPDVTIIPALGAENQAPPPYTEAASFSEYEEDSKVPTYEEVMTNKQIYDKARDGS